MNSYDYGRALGFHNKALEIIAKIYGEYHPLMATSYANIGRIYYILGEKDKALEYFTKTLAILEKVDGEDHPDTIAVKEKINELLSLNEE